MIGRPAFAWEYNFFFLSPACDIVHLPETCTSRQQDGEERQNERFVVCLFAYLHEIYTPVFVYAHVRAYICECVRVYIESGHCEVSALIRHAQKMSSICNDMGCDIRALLAGEMYCLSF